jgi:adenine-specific DNA-methyltransferase
METLIGFAGGSDALVLDPFAGSGATGHMVMRLNAPTAARGASSSLRRHARGPLLPHLRRAAAESRDRAGGLPGGFTFETKGRRLISSAILVLEREAIANLIVHTDATGRGRGITRVAGKYVIGHNTRQEAICLCWNGRTRSAITRSSRCSTKRRRAVCADRCASMGRRARSGDRLVPVLQDPRRAPRGAADLSILLRNFSNSIVR